MSEETQRLQAEVDIARKRAAATAEAIGYRTDVQARTKEAIGETAEAVKSTIVQGIGAVVQTAAGVQAAASDLTERARPHVDTVVGKAHNAAHAAGVTAQAAVESAQQVAQTAKAAVQTVAEGLLERVPEHDETIP